VRDVLRLGAHQLLATRVGHHAAVATSVDLAKDVCGPRPSGFVNAVLRRVATRDLDAWTEIVAPSRDRDPAGYLAVRHSHPRWIVEAFRDALGEPGAAELDDALAADNLRPDVTLAVTPGQAGANDHAPPDATPTRWSPYGLRLAGGDPGPLVAGGQAVVQDEASQLAALALARVSLSPADNASAPGPGEVWLDLCAGPGGKARLLAGLADERGARLVASDARPHRAARVRATLRSVHHRARLAPAVIAADGLRASWRPAAFDRVLADVPCSNLGSLRRRPEARWRKTPDNVPELAAVQRGLLNAAIESVRPGGVVAYVTCSPHLAETRDVVTAVADRRGDVTILDAPAVLAEVPGLGASDPRFAQFWPHRHGTDAIFLALLARRSPPGALDPPPSLVAPSSLLSPGDGAPFGSLTRRD
jgi:16S rRNA (cytosine967-C5)-methyltransferase